MGRKKIKRGDIYLVQPVGEGSMQQGERPAVMIGNNAGNRTSTVHPVVYITSKDKRNLPTHVEITLDRPGVILCEHPQSVPDRRIKSKIGQLSDDEMRRVNHALSIGLGLYSRKE